MKNKVMALLAIFAIINVIVCISIVVSPATFGVTRNSTAWVLAIDAAGATVFSLFFMWEALFQRAVYGKALKDIRSIHLP